MQPSQLDELKFLLKLQECRNYRAYLTNPCFKSFRAKDKICQNLASDGLVDFSREIVVVKLSAAGQALLKVTDTALPISAVELKLLQKIGTAKKIAPSQLRTSALTATERDVILQTFLNRGLILAETRLKRQKAEVWLTPQGQTCLAELLRQFQTLRQSATEITLNQKPTDTEVLATIQNLDHELASNNYLPIFYLRQKFQPPYRETSWMKFCIDCSETIRLNCGQSFILKTTRLNSSVPPFKPAQIVPYFLSK
ncbi:MAG: hypothetical protein EDM05_66645 [Leptolyngbya sp. IPPAS B-1204]